MRILDHIEQTLERTPSLPFEVVFEGERAMISYPEGGFTEMMESIEGILVTKHRMKSSGFEMSTKGIGEGVKIGNMVVASHTVQYDYDTTAIGEPKGFVMIGSEGVVQLPTSAKHNAVLEKYAEKIYNGVHTGVIATGDRFVADPAFCLQLKAEFGAISCEMETGAVAQVCAVNKTPFCGLRAISDNANDEGSVDFETFAKSSAEKCIELLKDAVGELNEVQ